MWELRLNGPFSVLLYLRRPHQFHLLGGNVGVRGAGGALRLRSLSRVGIHFDGSAFLKGASAVK